MPFCGVGIPLGETLELRVETDVQTDGQVGFADDRCPERVIAGRPSSPAARARRERRVAAETCRPDSATHFDFGGRRPRCRGSESGTKRSCDSRSTLGEIVPSSWLKARVASRLPSFKQVEISEGAHFAVHDRLRRFRRRRGLRCARGRSVWPEPTRRRGGCDGSSETAHVGGLRFPRAGPRCLRQSAVGFGAPWPGPSTHAELHARALS